MCVRRSLRAGLGAGLFAAGAAAVLRALKARRQGEAVRGSETEPAPWPPSPTPTPHGDRVSAEPSREAAPPEPTVMAAPAVMAAAAEPPAGVEAPAEGVSERGHKEEMVAHEQRERDELNRAEAEEALLADAKEGGAPVEVASPGDYSLGVDAPEAPMAEAIAEEGGKATTGDAEEPGQTQE